jgi:hypothetical protein
MLPIPNIRLGQPLAAIKVIIDVIKPFTMRRPALSCRLDRLLTEAAPEA